MRPTRLPVDQYRPRSGRGVPDEARSDRSAFCQLQRSVRPESYEATISQVLHGGDVQDLRGRETGGEHERRRLFRRELGGNLFREIQVSLPRCISAPEEISPFGTSLARIRCSPYEDFLLPPDVAWAYVARKIVFLCHEAAVARG